MADSDLEEIRRKRLEEMQQQAGMTDGQEQKKKREEEAAAMKNAILAQILSQEARARLNTIMLAKPEKGRAVENMLIQMAKTGQIGGSLSEQQLIGILERVNQQTRTSTTVKFDRRRAALDDSDDDY